MSDHIHRAARELGGPGSLYHPYECAHDETCWHCWRVVNEKHDPYECWTCDETPCSSCERKRRGLAG